MINRLKRIFFQGNKKQEQFGFLGKFVNAHKSNVYTKKENIFIGDYSYIGSKCFLSSEGGIEIGKCCSVSFGVTILSSNHNWENSTMIPYDQYSIKKSVKIGDFCWIGCNSMINPGVNIGEGAVVAMGSVVTKDIPPLAVVGGNPAKIIKFRDKEHFVKLKQDKRFYHQIKHYDVNFENIFLTQDEYSKLNKDS